MNRSPITRSPVRVLSSAFVLSAMVCCNGSSTSAVDQTGTGKAGSEGVAGAGGAGSPVGGAAGAPGSAGTPGAGKGGVAGSAGSAAQGPQGGGLGGVSGLGGLGGGQAGNAGASGGPSLGGQGAGGAGAGGMGTAGGGSGGAAGKAGAAGGGEGAASGQGGVSSGGTNQAGAAGASGSNTGPFIPIAGCTADDSTPETDIITVDPVNHTYTPACAYVPRGVMVHFVGASPEFPIFGMKMHGIQPNPLATGEPHTESSFTAEFDVVDGSYGYYDGNLGADASPGQSGMSGAIYVLPNLP